MVRGEGIALIVVLLTVTLLSGLIGGALFFTQIDLLITSNLKTGTQALYMAEAGLNHAIAIIPLGGNFSLPPPGLPLTGTFPPNSATTYTVTAVNDEVDPNVDTNQRIILTAVSNGKDGASRTIRAYVGREAGFTPPGGIYAPGTAVDTAFDGASFLVSGNDTNTDGTAGPNPAIPGISSSTDNTRDAITNSLVSGGHQDQVIGSGGSSSVQTSSLTLDPNQVANDLLTYPHVTQSGGTFAGNQTFGTQALPQITYITGDVRIEGTVSGVGALIIDGALTLGGSFHFEGLIIARGGVSTQQGGDSDIYGSLMLNTSNTPDSDVELDVRGNASLHYSSQALQVVNNLWGPALPKKAILLSWLEQME